MIIKRSFLCNLLSLCKKTVELKDNNVLIHWKLFGFLNVIGDAIPADHSVFFDQCQGLTGKTISFGSLEKTVEEKRFYREVGGEKYWNYTVYDIRGLKQVDVQKIKNYLIQCGSKLEDANATVFYSKFPVFRPLRWFLPREELRIGTEGILHKTKTFGRTRSSYVPYSNLKVFSGFGLFRKRLAIIGDVTINTKERFSKDVYNELQELVKKRANVLCKDGVLYRPALLSFKRRNKSMLLIDEGIIVVQGSKTYFFEYGEIEKYEFSKKNWWRIFGTLTCVAYRDDARDYSFTQWWLDESVHEFEIPGLPVWNWRILWVFRGKLKKLLKTRVKEAKKRIKQINRAVLKADVKDAFSDEIQAAKELKQELKSEIKNH